MLCSGAASCNRVWGSGNGTAAGVSMPVDVRQIHVLAVVSWLRSVSLGVGSELEARQLCRPGCDLGLDFGSM